MEIVRVMYTFSTAPNRSECNSTKHSGPSGWHLKEFHHSMLWVRFSNLQQQSSNLTSEGRHLAYCDITADRLLILGNQSLLIAGTHLWQLNAGTGFKRKC